MPTQELISNEELILKIQSSPIEDSAKEQLLGVVDKLDDSQRDELIAMLDSAEKEVHEEEMRYKKELVVINSKHTKELDLAVNKEKRIIVKNYESASVQYDVNSLDSLLTQVAEAAKLTKKAIQKKIPHGKHGVKKFMFFIALLAGLFAGAFYGLQYLSAI